MNDHSVNWFAKLLAKVPLRTLLIVPFVLQTVGLVAVVGYACTKRNFGIFFYLEVSKTIRPVREFRLIASREDLLPPRARL
jgi:hypothetical protein